MPDNIGILIFLHKLFCTAESYLVDIFIYFFGSHTHPFICNGKGFSSRIQGYLNTQFTYLGGSFPQGSQGS